MTTEESSKAVATIEQQYFDASKIPMLQKIFEDGYAKIKWSADENFCKAVTSLLNDTVKSKNVKGSAKRGVTFLCRQSDPWQAIRQMDNNHQIFDNPNNLPYNKCRPNSGNRFQDIDSFYSGNSIPRKNEDDSYDERRVKSETTARLILVQMKKILMDAAKIYTDKDVKNKVLCYKKEGKTDEWIAKVIKGEKFDNQELRFLQLYNAFKAVVNQICDLGGIAENYLSADIQLLLVETQEIIAQAIRPNFYKELVEALPTDVEAHSFSASKRKRLEIFKSFLNTDPTGITQRNARAASVNRPICLVDIKKVDMPQNPFQLSTFRRDFAESIQEVSWRFPVKRRHPWWDLLCHIVKHTFGYGYLKLGKDWNVSRYAMKLSKRAVVLGARQRKNNVAFFRIKSPATDGKPSAQDAVPTIESQYFDASKIPILGERFTASYAKIKWSSDENFHKALKSILSKIVESEDVKEKGKEGVAFLCDQSDPFEAIRQMDNNHQVLDKPMNLSYNQCAPDDGNRFQNVEAFFSAHSIPPKNEDDSYDERRVKSETKAQLILTQMKKILMDAAKIYTDKDFKNKVLCYKKKGKTDEWIAKVIKEEKFDNQELKFFKLYNAFKEVVEQMCDLGGMTENCLSADIQLLLVETQEIISQAIRPNFYKELVEALPTDVEAHSFSASKRRRLEIFKSFLNTDPTGITQRNARAASANLPICLVAIKKVDMPQKPFDLSAIRSEFATQIQKVSEQFPVKRRPPWWDKFCHIIMNEGRAREQVVAAPLLLDNIIISMN